MLTRPVEPLYSPLGQLPTTQTGLTALSRSTTKQAFDSAIQGLGIEERGRGRRTTALSRTVTDLVRERVRGALRNGGAQEQDGDQQNGEDQDEDERKRAQLLEAYQT